MLNNFIKIEDSITYLLSAVSVANKNYLEKTLNEIGLHSGQIFVLISLWKNDGQTQSDLAKEMNLSNATINRMVLSLSNNGFIECKRCEKDLRIVRVFLTQKAVETRMLFEEKWVLFEAEFYAGINDTEKLIFQQILYKLLDSDYLKLRRKK